MFVNLPNTSHFIHFQSVRQKEDNIRNQTNKNRLHFRSAPHQTTSLGYHADNILFTHLHRKAKRRKNSLFRLRCFVMSPSLFRLRYVAIVISLCRLRYFPSLFRYFTFVISPSLFRYVAFVISLCRLRYFPSLFRYLTFVISPSLFRYVAFVISLCRLRYFVMSPLLFRLLYFPFVISLCRLRNLVFVFVISLFCGENDLLRIARRLIARRQNVLFYYVAFVISLFRPRHFAFVFSLFRSEKTQYASFRLRYF